MKLEDWEREHYTDHIYAAERQHDLMMSWWREEFLKPASITIKHVKNANKSKSVRRTYKKIVLSRSHLSTKVNRESI